MSEPVNLDESTWDWLVGAFVAIGFSAENVKEFFDDQRP